jgi:predicted transcriptional regulator
MPPLPGLGRRLKTARTRANMTQEHLARKARIGRVYFARLESGRYDPRASIVVRRARALQCLVLTFPVQWKNSL